MRPRKPIEQSAHPDAAEPKEDEIVVTCPQCRAKVTMSVKDAEETMNARCPKGHDIPLVRGL
jgi:hypothetical protein